MAKFGRAHWHELSPEEKTILEGHVGPDWLPQWFCNQMSGGFKSLFDIADQSHHDFGYLVGGDAAFRRRCDFCLLRKLYKDSERHEGEKRRLAFFVSDLIYLCVRLFGGLSFKWRERSLTTVEIKAVLCEKQERRKNRRESSWKLFALILVFLPLVLFSLLSYLTFLTLPFFTDWRKRSNTEKDNAPARDQQVETG